jgi:hypothetical protein
MGTRVQKLNLERWLVKIALRFKAEENTRRFRGTAEGIVS